MKNTLLRLARLEYFAANMTAASIIVILGAVLFDMATGHTSDLVIPLYMVASCTGALFLPVWLFAILARIGGERQ